MTVLRELIKYKSDLVKVQVVRWENTYFFYGKGNENHESDYKLWTRN
jgi:hypothetical protein